jgi:hypothetical protein
MLSREFIPGFFNSRRAVAFPYRVPIKEGRFIVSGMSTLPGKKDAAKLSGIQKNTRAP